MELDWCSLFQELIGDDQLLNFGSAFVNAQRAPVAIKPLHDRAAHQAGAAMNLHGLIDDAPGVFSSEKFCFARFPSRRCGALVFQVRGAINQKARGVQLGRHVGEFLLNQLMTRHRAAELFA